MTANSKIKEQIFHIDKRDDILAVSVPIGNFTEGGLGFSELDVAVKLQVEDFAVFRGSEYYHRVTQYVGERMSLVFCVKQKTLKNRIKLIF